VFKRVYLVNLTATGLRCRIAGRCASRRSSRCNQCFHRSGVVADAPEHHPTAGGGRQPGHPAGADARRRPEGAQLAWQRPGCARLTASYLRARPVLQRWLPRTRHLRSGRPSLSTRPTREALRPTRPLLRVRVVRPATDGAIRGREPRQRVQCSPRCVEAAHSGRV
jgi:hypothetical protein